jgi:hypothetical protein
MAKRLTETEWARIENRRLVRELETMVRRMFARMRGEWQPAPRDPGFVPGGIRERAIPR